MRLYLIANRYSMGIQAGIQAMHVIPELYEKFKGGNWDSEYSDNLSIWAREHKTIMLLRHFGGDEATENLYAEIAKPARELKLPFAIFREEALRNSATAVGVVVPTEYYSLPLEDLDKNLQNLRVVLDKYPFAN